MNTIFNTAPPFLVKFKGDKNAEKIVLITKNTHNLFTGVYLTGANQGKESTGLNSNFLELYDGDINNEMML